MLMSSRALQAIIGRKITPTRMEDRAPFAQLADKNPHPGSMARMHCIRTRTHKAAETRGEGTGHQASGTRGEGGGGRPVMFVPLTSPLVSVFTPASALTRGLVSGTILSFLTSMSHSAASASLCISAYLP